jgi:hypothetical protein
MIRTRSIIAACTLALLAGCGGARTPQKAATQADTATHAASQARPKIFEPIHRATAASDSMAARAARMNAATDSILH